MIKTKRLILKPLSPVELEKYLKAPNDLANDLGLTPSATKMDQETSEAILNDLLPHVSDSSKNYLFYTMWIVIEKNLKAIIGGICFHGEPDENGEVEIGFGTDDDYQNKGYMTEVIRGMIEWSKNQGKITVLRAETNNDNISSQKVLMKNGFQISKQNEDTTIFKLKV